MKLNDPVAFAKVFASNLHQDQGQYYGDLPYSKHLDHVVSTLLHFDYTDKALLAAGYLHDTIEDTGVSQGIIFELFGPDVGSLVTAVTDEPGVNRKERKAKTYPKIKTAGERAVALKLADRIANVENSLTTNNLRMQKMYKKEYPELSLNLRTIGQLESMWARLQTLITQIP